jgi:hypothetical protein
MNTTTPDTDDFFTPEAPGTGGETTTPEQFTIQTREHAEWYLRKLANLDREEASIRAQAEAMLKRVRSDREKYTGRYASQFESFTRGELEKQRGSRRSVLYFNGTAQFITVAPRFVVESEADAMQTARLVLPEAIEAIPASEKLNKKALLDYAAKQFEANQGELIPGVGRTEAGERFAIKFPTEKGATSDPDE